MGNPLIKVYEFYRDGFRSMTIGRTLWLVIAIKLAIMFLVLKIFFFPNKLASEYENDEQRSEAVMNSLLQKNSK